MPLLTCWFDIFGATLVLLALFSHDKVWFEVSARFQESLCYTISRILLWNKYQFPPPTSTHIHIALRNVQAISHCCTITSRTAKEHRSHRNISIKSWFRALTANYLFNSPQGRKKKPTPKHKQFHVWRTYRTPGSTEEFCWNQLFNSQSFERLLSRNLTSIFQSAHLQELLQSEVHKQTLPHKIWDLRSYQCSQLPCCSVLLQGWTKYQCSFHIGVICG